MKLEVEFGNKTIETVVNIKMSNYSSLKGYVANLTLLCITLKYKNGMEVGTKEHTHRATLELFC